MKKMITISALLLLGFGCNQKPLINNEVVSNDTIQDAVSDEVFVSSTAPSVTSTTAAPKKLAVERSFTVEEIEAEGGLKEWFRELARANVIGKKTIVRVPVTHIYGFGCETPTKYCVSTNPSGCYGPFLDLKGQSGVVESASLSCRSVCDNIQDARCDLEFKNKQCSIIWAVEGYVVAASKAKVSGEEGDSCAEEGELIYDFEVTRVIEKVGPDSADEYKIVEYK